MHSESSRRGRDWEDAAIKAKVIAGSFLDVIRNRDSEMEKKLTFQLAFQQFFAIRTDKVGGATVNANCHQNSRTISYKLFLEM